MSYENQDSEETITVDTLGNSESKSSLSVCNIFK